MTDASPSSLPVASTGLQAKFSTSPLSSPHLAMYTASCLRGDGAGKLWDSYSNCVEATCPEGFQ